jgi:hypothetical protein
MDLVRRVHRQGLVVLIIVSVLSAFIERPKLPVGILFGGLLGLANLKGLEWGLTRFFGTTRPQGKLIFLSFFRFFALTCVLLLLAILKLVNFLGILIGFTIVFVLVLKEGLRAAKQQLPPEDH